MLGEKSLLRMKNLLTHPPPRGNKTPPYNHIQFNIHAVYRYRPNVLSNQLYILLCPVSCGKFGILVRGGPSNQQGGIFWKKIKKMHSSRWNHMHASVLQN